MNRLFPPALVVFVFELFSHQTSPLDQGGVFDQFGSEKGRSGLGRADGDDVALVCHAVLDLGRIECRR